MMTTRSDGAGMVTNGSGLPPIKETIGTPAWRARRVAGRTFGSALAMTVACGATMLVASQLRSGSPWASLNAMASAVGLGPRRAKKRFDMTTTLAGAGVLAAGFLAYAALYQGTLAATGRSGRRGSLLSKLFAAAGGYAADQLLAR